MSEIFTGREKALEDKFAHEEEMRFKTETKAVELFSLWAASKLGLKNGAATEYAVKMSTQYIQRKGLFSVINAVRKDFVGKELDSSTENLEHRFEHYRDAARKMTMQKVNSLLP